VLDSATTKETPATTGDELPACPHDTASQGSGSRPLFLPYCINTAKLWEMPPLHSTLWQYFRTEWGAHYGLHEGSVQGRPACVSSQCRTTAGHVDAGQPPVFPIHLVPNSEISPHPVHYWCAMEVSLPLDSATKRETLAPPEWQCSTRGEAACR
jgi:hypothetical protein